MTIAKRYLAVSPSHCLNLALSQGLGAPARVRTAAAMRPVASCDVTDDQALVKRDLPSLPDQPTRGVETETDCAGTASGEPEDAVHVPAGKLQRPATGGRRRRPNRFDRPREPRDWRWAVGGAGRLLISIGVLMFAFVGYQLWGTGIQTAQAQNRLADEFAAELATVTPRTTAAPTTTVAPTTTTTPTTAAGAVAAAPAPTTTPPQTTTTQPLPLIGRPTLGDGVAHLAIPSIGLDKMILEGIRPTDLQDGPGHFPETPLPGQFGNAAIAGHRTTHGQPFFRIDEIEVGDEIVVTTLAGQYVYVMTGRRIVSPSDYASVIPTLDPSVATLTLTSCDPKFSAKNRIVISALIDLAQSDLVTAPFGPLDDPNAAAGFDDGTDDPTLSPTGSAAVGTSLASAPSASATGADSVDAGDDTSTSVTTPDTLTTAPGDSAPDEPAPGNPTSGDPTSGGEPTGDTAALAADSQELFANRWFSDPSANAHVGAWGVLLTVVAIGAYLLSRRTRRNWVGALVGFAPFVIVLYFFFENVNRLLPPNL